MANRRPQGNPVRVSVIRRRARKQYALRWKGGEQIAEARWGDEAAAYREAFELEDRLNNPTAAILSWKAAAKAYEDWHLVHHSREHRKSWTTARHWFERWSDGEPADIPRIDNAMMAKFAADLSQAVAMDTARTYCQYLRSFFKWCHDQEWIDRIPRVKLPSRKRGDKRAKGRPLVGEEFERMLAVIPSIVGEVYAPSWRFAVCGLWETSLRLSEAMRLHWTDGDIRVNLTGRFPMIDFTVEGDKGRRERQLPITREFAAMLQTQKQRGYVFRPRLSRGVTRNSSTWSHTISKFGEAAGIIVDVNSRTKKTKYASAHDLRRSFLERWRGKVDSAVLQVLARHESISTTERYYLGDQAEAVAAAIWGDGGEVVEL